MASTSQSDRELLARCDSEPASLELLREVCKVKERLVQAQNFNEASTFRDTERKLQKDLRNPDQISRFGISLEIKRFTVPLDPAIDLFHVVVGKGSGVWLETISGEENLFWFLRGLKAASPSGMIPEHELPHRGIRLKLVEDQDFSFD
ncbi:MAG: hypothetical protein M3Q24_02440 [bacterium]|nr:hypothetical protein [bacterium]